jgi:N-acetylmuramic acid 6-phosphate etherase
MVRAREGPEDEPGQAIDLVRRHGVARNDVLIAVAASGTTPFTLACLREAKRCSALTLGIANNPGTPLLQEAEHAIFLETGPEPIAGSTRMNAGTAQRIALSLLSSLVMIRLGKVYAGLMVDVQASNAKIAERRENMLIHLTGSSGEDVREALKRARGSVKLALLLLKGCDLKEAERVLDRAGGQLRGALALVAQDPSSGRRRTAGESPRARHAS